MLEELSQPQRDRLAFIDMRLRLLGYLRRQHLIDHFEIQEAAASRDIALYKKLCPQNIEYDSASRVYRVSHQYSGLFTPSAEQALTWASRGGAATQTKENIPWVDAMAPDQLSWPKLDVIGQVTRAIHQRCPLYIEYESLNGTSKRVIAPYSLVDNGLRWHVRGYDRQSSEFRDFVLTRLRTARPLESEQVESHESRDNDTQWTTFVELHLVPHPDQPRPEVTVLDHDMVDGVMKLKIRAATAGYTLRKWCVDCSTDHRLRGNEYRLWLANPDALRDVHNAVLAPGYKLGESEFV